MFRSLGLLPIFLLTACTVDVGDGAILGEVWADNWSSLYVNGELVMEDSVSIDTERSFNQESFSFDADRPFELAAVLKDFKENDSGLEYIGEGNQQMGDGGYIAQFTDRDSGEVIAVSSSEWRCLVTHHAPVDKSCEGSGDPLSDCDWVVTDEPVDWTAADFDDSGWDAATEHSSTDVGPKDGYDEISWDSSAQLIWGSDLESDNTLLCRFTVE